MAIKFFVPGLPATQDSKRHVGGGHIIDSCKRLPEWRAAVGYHAAQARTGALIEDAVMLHLYFRMPRPKSHMGKKGLRLTAPLEHIKKPDLSKMVRAVEDALKGVIWLDDSQVVLLTAQKRYCKGNEKPGVIVVINELWEKTKGADNET